MTAAILPGRAVGVRTSAPDYRGKISFVLSGVDDYTPSIPFINLMKQARPWYVSGGISASDVKAGGYVDANNWPKEIPPGETYLETFMAWGNRAGVSAREGNYILKWDGDGTIVVDQGGTGMTPVGSNRIDFFLTGGTLRLRINSVDPSDNIRNMTLIRSSWVDDYENGAIFNPDWIAWLNQFNIDSLRFMNWQETNNSIHQEFSGLTPVTGMQYRVGSGYSGMAIEDMVALANLLEVNPWFCMPHRASAAFSESFAQYVKDNLDPALKAKVEYSNEIWNSGFNQTKWLETQAETEWSNTTTTGRDGYGMKLAVRMANAWKSVFTGGDAGRLILVLGTQASQTSTTLRYLQASAWQAAEPEDFVPPADVFDELSATNYFGSAIVGNRSRVTDILAAYHATAPGDMAAAIAATDVHAKFLADTVRAARWEPQKAVADDYGLTLTSYEGGQHVHHSAQATYPSQDRSADGEMTTFSFPDITPGDEYFSIRVQLRHPTESNVILDPEDYIIAPMEGGGTQVTYPLEGDPLAAPYSLRVSERYGPGMEEDLTDILKAYVRSEEIVPNYRTIWNQWRNVSGTTFMQYTEMAAPSDSGSWGAATWVGDETPRLEFLLNVAGAPEE